MKPAVFLDRDNTIIHNDGDLGDPDEVRLIQGAASAIASLQGLGYKIVVVSNQGGVARGVFTEADVQAVNEKIHALVQQTTGADIDRFFYCPYHPEGSVDRYRREHPWRKPKPGMIMEAAKVMALDLSRSWMIGDQPRDVEAGKAAGVHTVLLRADAPATEPVDGGEGVSSKITEVKSQLGDADESGRVTHIAPNLIEAVKIVAQTPIPRRVHPPASKPSAEPERPGVVTVSQSRVGASASTAGGARTSRTFRPWGAPEADDTEKDAAASPSPPPQPSPSERAVETKPQSRPPTQPSVKSAPPAAGRASSEGASPAPSRVEEPMTSSSTEHVLQRVLREMRQQHNAAHDFSYLTVLAIVLQMIALVCLAAGLWLSGDDITVFFRWVGTALMLQLATIATLQFRH